MPSSPSLTIQDLNRLLFEMEPTSAIEYTDNNSAAALSLGGSSSAHHQPQKTPEPNSLLASIIGDLVPAAEAVLGDQQISYNFNNNATRYMDTTPYMDTPYLDPTTPYMDHHHTIGTPYTPFTPTVTPSMNGTPHFSPFLDGKDISMASYLVENTNNYNVGSSSSEPLAAFNGDPALLLLDKGKSTDANVSMTAAAAAAMTTTTTHANSAPLTWHDEPAAESSDMLFPPLPGDNSQPTSSDNMDLDFAGDAQCDGFMNELLGFDFSGSVTTSSTNNNAEQSGSTASNDSDNKSNANNGSSSDDKANTTNVDINNTVGETANHAESNNTMNKNKKRKRNAATGDENATNKRRAKTASTEKKFQCDVCKLMFSRRYNLGTHIKTHNKQREKEYMCSICLKGFDRKHDRDRHVSTVHHGERSYACERCPASFSRKDALSRHLDHKHGVV